MDQIEFNATIITARSNNAVSPLSYVASLSSFNMYRSPNNIGFISIGCANTVVSNDFLFYSEFKKMACMYLCKAADLNQIGNRFTESLSCYML